MGTITLITGGVRSGKSSYALSYANSLQGVKAFIATAIPFDNEMVERIVHHQAERGNNFKTIEEPYDLPKSIERIDSSISIVVVDCLTVWLGNLFYKYENKIELIKTSICQLCENLKKSHANVVLITNEVGWGIVPDNKLSRDFRDCNGWMNQKIASVANRVVLCTCGIPVEIKR